MGEQYLSEFRDDDVKPEKFPLELMLCEECSLVQLNHTTPPEKLYGDGYGYYSGINDTIKADLKDVVDKAWIKIGVDKMDTQDIVVDIGSNDATLLKNYPPFFKRVGFDLVPKFKKYYDQDNLTFINEPFSYKAFSKKFPGKKAKIITAISMFYDLDDPNTFVQDLVRTLDEDGLLVIQQNYIVGMLNQLAFDNIVHEHLEYYSLNSLTRLLNKHGLEIVDAEVNDINGGSFRVYVRHMSTLRKMRIVEQKMKLNTKWAYYLFAMKVNNVRNKLFKFVEQEVANGKSVYVYGASTRGNTLLQFAGLDNKYIKYAVERNPDKFGKKIAALGIPIISEEQARKDKPDYFLVMPWFFKEEFIKREKEYLDAGGHLIFPLPEFHVV